MGIKRRSSFRDHSPKAGSGTFAKRASPVDTSPAYVFDVGLPEGFEELTQKSTLYRAFLDEREEILRHKWLESEKLGRDIGFEAALLDWVRNYRTSWKAQRNQGSR